MSGTPDSTKQSQSRRSFKCEVSSVRQREPGAGSSHFKRKLGGAQSCETKPIGKGIRSQGSGVGDRHPMPDP